MIKQYTDSYSSIPSQVVSIVNNKCSLLDKFIIMQTGDRQYTALIYNVCSKKGKQYIFSRSSNFNNNYYTVSESDISSFDYTVTNEYYVYSNDGIGQSVDLMVYHGATSHAVVIVSLFAMFAVIFKGALFKCLRRKR